MPATMTDRILTTGGSGRLRQTLVDALPAMLRRARRRAPATTFITGDAVSAEVGSGYDRVVLSFLLYNFDEEGRVRLLRRASRALVDGGRIGILDWRAGGGHLRAAMWESLLRAIEPSSTVAESSMERWVATFRRPACASTPTVPSPEVVLDSHRRTSVLSASDGNPCKFGALTRRTFL